VKLLLATIFVALLPAAALAQGSIPWEFVHAQIKAEDPKLIAFVDAHFELKTSGLAMRPLVGEHAGERLAPYNFFAKPKGAAGEYIFNLTFDVTNEKTHPWTILIQDKWY
jgi:hypothetical protein